MTRHNQAKRQDLKANPSPTLEKKQITENLGSLILALTKPLRLENTDEQILTETSKKNQYILETIRTLLEDQQKATQSAFKKTIKSWEASNKIVENIALDLQEQIRSDENSQREYIDRASSQLATEKKNKELILEELHTTQEELAKHLLLAKKTLEEKNKTENQITFLQDQSHEFLTNKITHIEILSENPLKILWTLKETYIFDQHIPIFDFETTIENQKLEISLTDHGKMAAGLSPATGKNPPDFSFPLNLSSASTTGWRLRRSILLYLLRKISSGQCLSYSEAEPMISAISHELRNHSRESNRFRYDEVSLIESIEIYPYASLRLLLKNASFGALAWPDISFSFSAVKLIASENIEKIEYSPRLEFAEGESKYLERWFPESRDERGARLELRFVPPHDFDFHVWNKLASRDQMLVSGLIASLPQQIADLAFQENATNLQVDHWVYLAEEVKRTLRNVLKRLRNDVPS